MRLFDLIFRWPSQQKFSRPFYKNKTKAEFKEWFSKAPSWNKVDSRITDALIEYYWNNPMFEVFVHVSWELDLVKKYVVPAPSRLRDIPFDIGNIVIIGDITGVLCQAGCSCRDRVVKLISTSQWEHEDLKKYYRLAAGAFESSLQLQRTFLPSYVQLALLKHLLKRDDEAREYCNQGLAQVEMLKKSPLRLSDPELKLMASVEEGEAQLKSMLKELEVSL